MRRSAVLLLLLLSTTMVPVGQAAEPFATDATGDVSIKVVGPADTPLPATLPNGVTDFADLIAFDVEETPDTVVFHLDLVKLDETVPFVRYEVWFTWNDVHFVARLFPFPFKAVTGDSFRVGLYHVDSDGQLEFAGDLEGAFDLQANRVTIEVPRVFVLDQQDRFPQKGAILTDVQALSMAWMRITLAGSVGGGVELTDVAPDEPTVYEFKTGDLSEGPLRLLSEEPVRVSNGGATTFVYPFALVNTGAAPDEVRLSPLELPEGWRVNVDSPVRVGPGETLDLMALVSVPFAHEHGGFTTFDLEARSARDASAFSRLRLGVLHTPIPQPAGHHPDLFLHGAAPEDVLNTMFGSGTVFMNTVADHATDAEEVDPNDYEDGAVWSIDLQPELRMGLDFDLDAVGQLVGSIQTADNGAGELSAELVLASEESEIVLASGRPFQIQGDIQKPVAFAFDLDLTPEADYVAYARGVTLRLRLTYTSEANDLCCLPGASPMLRTTDFKLSLPLREYHDRIALGPSGRAGLIGISAQGAVEKAVKPGAMATYAFDLKNSAAEEVNVVLAIAGSDAAQGVLTPSGEVHLGPDESRVVTLGVRVPADATEAQAYEVLVFARAKDDPSLSAIGRTMTTVAFGEGTVADESAVFAAAEDASNDTPGPGFAFVVGASLVALAISGRRRRA